MSVRSVSFCVLTVIGLWLAFDIDFRGGGGESGLGWQPDRDRSIAHINAAWSLEAGLCTSKFWSVWVGANNDPEIEGKLCLAVLI